MTTRSALVLTWNVEWRLSNSASADVLRARMAEHDPDIICLTEAYADMLSGGHQIEADEDYGYPIRKGRRKVLLWSKEPWTDVDTVGSPYLPSGRFVRGTTSTPIGPMTAMGLCVPWSGAHVTSGRRNKKPWDDHLAYLAALGDILPREPERMVVLGDFNQKVPRSSAPKRAYDALEQTVLRRMTFATMGKIEPLDCALIDHVAHSPDLTSRNVCTLDNAQAEGPRLTDHVGVAVELALRCDDAAR